jgi:hypothetical protein
MSGVLAQFRKTATASATSTAPRGEEECTMNFDDQWTVYRTRFLVRARQLKQPLIFTDALGREQSGGPGDYVVESSDGVTRITTQALFEDIYVPLVPALLLPPRATDESAALPSSASTSSARVLPPLGWRPSQNSPPYPAT